MTFCVGFCLRLRSRPQYFHLSQFLVLEAIISTKCQVFCQHFLHTRPDHSDFVSRALVPARAALTANPPVDIRGPTINTVGSFNSIKFFQFFNFSIFFSIFSISIKDSLKVMVFELGHTYPWGVLQDFLRANQTQEALKDSISRSLTSKGTLSYS